MSDPKKTITCVRSASVAPTVRTEDETDTEKQAGVLSLRWTSSAQVVRQDWFGDEFVEILDPAGADLRRLNDGAPLLDSHRAFSSAGVIGSVVRGSARMDGAEGFADVRLSDAPSAADTRQKIEEGSINSVSVGYSIDAYEWVTPKEGRAELRVSRWTPLEVSAVPVPADARAQFLRALMPAGGVKMTERSIPADAPETPAAVDVAEIQRAERERVRYCTEFARAQKIDDAQASAIIDKGLPQAETVAALWDVAAKRAAAVGPQQVGSGVSVIVDSTEKLRERFVHALLVRMDGQGVAATAKDREIAGDFARLSLPQMAGDCLVAGGGAVSRYDQPKDIMARAMRMHRAAPMSTSDFVSITAEAVSTALARTVINTARFFAPFAGRQDFRDLRPVPLHDIGYGSQLTALTEGQDTEYGVVTDGKETMRGVRMGKKFLLTGDALAADDVGVLAAFVSTLGQIVPASENAYAAAIFISNPTMSDGNAFFSAAHNNLIASGGVPSYDQIAATLDMDAADLDGNPAEWSPAAYVASRSNAWLLKILFGQVVNTTTTAATDPIPSDMVAPVLTHPSITGDPWYIFGPPALRGFVIGYKNGQTAPEIFTEADEGRWAVEYTMRHFFAAAWQNWNAVRKNAGA